jgi:hypothetical protein
MVTFLATEVPSAMLEGLMPRAFRIAATITNWNIETKSSQSAGRDKNRLDRNLPALLHKFPDSGL